MDEQEKSETCPKKSYGIDYLVTKRLFSYGHQLHATLSFRPESVLEVGIGSGLVAASLRAAGVKVSTLDLKPDHSPDYVGSVLDMPVESESVDVAVCCQVLEHLDFQDFSKALRELRRVARKGLVLSLPDVSRWYYVRFRLPCMTPRLWQFTPSFLPSPPLPPFGAKKSGHKWEIGYQGSSLAQVTETIRNSGWRIDRTWRVPEHNWHRFFDLRPL